MRTRKKYYSIFSTIRIIVHNASSIREVVFDQYTNMMLLKRYTRYKD